jgi:hypothetical protein
MLYGSECLAVDMRIEHCMSVAEMRMLRWTSRVTREDRIRNEYLKGSIGVASIVNKMRENRQIIWACDEARGNKISKSGYKNER